METQLREKLDEIERLKTLLEKENIYLREEIELQNVHEEIVGRSKAMIAILAQVEQVARTDATVLIEGETGLGKTKLLQLLDQDAPLHVTHVHQESLAAGKVVHRLERG